MTNNDFKFLKNQECSDDIFKAWINNSSKFILDVERLDMHIEADLDKRIKAIQHKYTKMFSKKMRQELMSQSYYIHVKQAQTYIFYDIEFKNRRSSATDSCCVYYASPPSNKGLIYYAIDKTKDFTCIHAFFSHFFDRFSQRLYNNELSRVEAIQQWLSRESDDSLKIINPSTNEYIHLYGNDLILGHVVPFEKAVLIAMHTFVNSESITDENKVFIKQAREGLLKDYLVVNNGEFINIPHKE